MFGSIAFFLLCLGVMKLNDWALYGTNDGGTFYVGCLALVGLVNGFVELAG